MHFIVALLLAAQEPQERATRSVEIPRIEAAVSIDGDLDEPVWSQAARLDSFSQYEPTDSRPAEEETQVLVWYAPDAIHFGIHARDRQPEAIRATRADRDNIDNDDHVIIYLDTFNDRRRAFFFAVNPLGIQKDGVRTEGASSAGQIFGGNIDTSPDYLFESKGKVGADGYIVEVRIPFKSLRFPGTGAQEWGLQIERRIKRTGYGDTWTDVRRASASFLIQAGTIRGLHDLRRGVVLEAQPFVAASANGARQPAGGFERNTLDPDAGLNARVGFTNISIDATLNPDFSQVESDVGQVTLNERFALFVPEKRPFFLEGIELFSTPNSLVYTRQVANPLLGGKITGKLGQVGIAYLSALDEGVGEDPNALFNVARIRRDFGSNSVVAATITNRTALSSGYHNSVASADVRYVFGGMYYLLGQYGTSWTASGGPTRVDPIWRAEFDRTGRSWGFSYVINGIGDDFETRAGFVPRNGIINGHAFNRFTYYGAKGALLENFTTFFGPRRLWNYGTLRDATEGGEEVIFIIRLRGGWEPQVNVGRGFAVLDPSAYGALRTQTGASYVPFSDIGGPFIGLSVRTPTFQRFSGFLFARTGREAIFPEGSEGRAAFAQFEVTFRPTQSLRFAAANTYVVLDRRRDGSRFGRTILPRVQAEFQPTRALSFRVIAEYRSERQAALLDARTGLPLLSGGAPVPALEVDDLRMDFLASFKPTPGTVAFIGYGSSLDARNTFDFTDVARTSDGFFVKLAYQFRK